jgi:hypothetical protein
MDHACATAHTQMASHTYFISQKTTPPCPAGSRAWRPLFGSVVCGPRKTFSPSARVFTAPLAGLTAVAGAFFFPSPISSLKSPSFKSWLSLADTYAISIPNITVNSTLSNNIGGRQSSVSVWLGARRQSTRWRGRSSNVSMTSPSFTFGGESSTFLF